MLCVEGACEKYMTRQERCFGCAMFQALLCVMEVSQRWNWLVTLLQLLLTAWSWRPPVLRPGASSPDSELMTFTFSNTRPNGHILL